MPVGNETLRFTPAITAVRLQRRRAGESANRDKLVR